VSQRSDPTNSPFPLPHILQPGEVLEGHADANGSVIAVTGERLVVAEGDKAVLDVPFDELRRIQFDIEHHRDATLVIVPEHISNWPIVVTVPPSQLMQTALVLARIGEHLSHGGEQKTG
jgi:hypothetical protein